MKAINTGLLQFYDPNTGKPVANGYVATYDTVSTSPKETFADVNGLVTNPNPVPLDSTGSAYIFGEGSYTFVIKNSAGVNVRTIENIGIQAGGAYEVDGDTPTLDIGGGNNGYDSDDLMAIYSKDEPHELLGLGDISEIVLQANVDNNNAAGDYETVSALYASSSAAVPSGTLVFDGPQDGYDPVSTRLYEFKSDGSFSVDPQSDTEVDETGIGDNYIDLFRKAATEEMRIKRTPMYWDACKNLIGLQTIEYPIIVIGSNGKFYTSSGSPTAEQIATTDPVLDTSNTVWTFVYDPTETAQYPPWYRSPRQGVRWDDTDSISIYSQSCKLLDASGDFTNDGNITSSYFKSAQPWEFGAGSTGSPVGGYTSGSAYGGTGWLDVFIIKTTGTDVDVCLAAQGAALADIFAILNAKAAEVSAGRTWAYGRRIATVYAAGTAFRQFKTAGAGTYIMISEYSIGTGTVNVSTYVPNCGAGFFWGMVNGGSEDTSSYIYLKENGAVMAQARCKVGSNFANSGVTTGLVRIRPNSSNNIAVATSGDGDAFCYCTGFQDLYED